MELPEKLEYGYEAGIKENKPVEQELVPLDVEKHAEEIIERFTTTLALRFGEVTYEKGELMSVLAKELSKYGVPKQEEKIDILPHQKEMQDKIEAYRDDKGTVSHRPKQEATSVIDVDGVLRKIRSCFSAFDKQRNTLGVDYVNCQIDELKKILSSLPIQKKRTVKEIEEYRNLDCLESEVKYTIQFLQDHGLLSE